MLIIHTLIEEIYNDIQINEIEFYKLDKDIKKKCEVTKISRHTTVGIDELDC